MWRNVPGLSSFVVVLSGVLFNAHAFGQGYSAVPLTELPDSFDNFASALSDNGTVVGWAYVPSPYGSPPHVVVWDSAGVPNDVLGDERFGGRGTHIDAFGSIWGYGSSFYKFALQSCDHEFALSDLGAYARGTSIYEGAYFTGITGRAPDGAFLINNFAVIIGDDTPYNAGNENWHGLYKFKNGQYSKPPFYPVGINDDEDLVGTRSYNLIRNFESH